MSDTVPVEVHVAGIQKLVGTGSLLALAMVEVSVPVVGGSFDFRLQGVQVRRTQDNRLLCQAPQFRDPTSGRWLPAVLLPPELRDAIGAEVLAEMEVATA